MGEASPGIENMVFVAAKGKVVALDRCDGSVLWRWRAGKGAGFWASLVMSDFTSIAIDGDRLMVATSRFIWCLEPMTGETVWKSKIKDFSGGYPLIVTARSGQGLSGQHAAAASTASTSGLAAAGIED